MRHLASSFYKRFAPPAAASESRTPGPGLRVLRHRGFTLTELLVVIAITAILLTVLFIPLTRSLELSARGTAKAGVQDGVRGAIRRVTRDLANAMDVLEPRPIWVWGYTTWAVTRRNKPIPDTRTAAPYVVPNGVIALRLPRQQYFDTVLEHYVTPEDIGLGVGSDDVALDSCPRHPGNPVELRVVLPMEPEARLTAYFVALKDARLRDAQNNPLYANLHLFSNTVTASPSVLNTYTLYRLEFDPTHPAFANWNEDLNGNRVLDAGEDVDGDRRLGPNPNFFYDTRLAANNRPYWMNWDALANPSRYAADANLNTLRLAGSLTSVVDSETTDAVRWVQTLDKFIPHPLCTFGPSGVDEALQPNRSVGQYLLDGTLLPGDLPPLEYVASSGHWVGWPSQAPAGGWADGLTLVPDTAVITNTPITGQISGPRIRIQEQRLGRLVTVFDSGLPIDPAANPRSRLVAFDASTGKVRLAVQRTDFQQPTGSLAREHFVVRGAQLFDLSTFSTDLSLDRTQDPNGMPASYGEARRDARFFNPATGVGTLLIAPGSEVVQIADYTRNANTPDLQPLRRAGWTGLGSTLDRHVAQGDLDAFEYTIDYRTGLLTFSDRDPTLWAAQVAGGGLQLLVKYQFQTNASRLEEIPPNSGQFQTTTTDIVRASYNTRELAAVNLGLIQYTRKKNEALSFEVSERVAIRNLRR